jgi:hypothetical protein
VAEYKLEEVPSGPKDVPVNTTDSPPAVSSVEAVTPVTLGALYELLVESAALC